MLRRRSHLALWLTTSLVIILLPHLVWGQRTESADWAADIANRYRKEGVKGNGDQFPRRGQPHESTTSSPAPGA